MDSAEDWRRRAEGLVVEGRPFVDGAPVDPTNLAALALVNPADGRSWAQSFCADEALVDRAVASARGAFEDARWRGTAPRERKRTLLALADLVRRNADELALLESLCVGKPVRDALGIDVRATADCFQYYAECCDKLYGEVAPTDSARLLVDRRIARDVMAVLAEEARNWSPSDPLEPSSRAGAVVSKAHFDKVMSYVDLGRSEGGRVVVGGRALHRDTGGYFVEPTVIEGVEPRSRLAQEEVFGPVLAVIAFDGVDEAVRIANDTQYGLAAAVWTRDFSTAHRAARALRSGVVYVNTYDADDLTVPFGGFKQSGIGRDRSLHAVDKYTETKSIWMRL